ncbi:MAG: hypothetical protein RLZZ444_29, partial [Pseudomonadota bacterium]
LVFYAGAYGDIISGGALDDRLFGLGGDDVLKGLGGNDYIDGGTGKQNLDGGDGVDTLSFDLSEATSSLTIKMQKVIDLGTFGTARNFERFGFVDTGEGNDTIFASDQGSGVFYSHGGADEFNGGADNDIWYMGTGGDIGNMGAGDDMAYIEVSENFDTSAKNVHGGAGNDRIIGAGGGDALFGDSGNDNINAGRGADTVDGGIGNDTLSGGQGADHLIGGTGNDTLEADRDYTTFNTSIGYDADRLDGGDGNDSLQGGFGADILNGGDGDDQVVLDCWDGSSNPDAAVDTANGGAGKDKLILNLPVDFDLTLALSSSMTIKVKGVTTANATGFEVLQVNASGAGSTYADLDLTGGKYDDSFWTSSGDDTLKGLGGNDFLHASEGSDTVDGGTGDDRIDVMIDGDDRIDAGAGNDLVIVRQLRSGYTAGTSIYDAGDGIDTLSLEAGSTDLALVGNQIRIGGITVATAKNWETLNFYGSSLGSTIVGGSRDDTFTLLGGDDKATGGNGNDTFIDYGGKNTFDGGAGSDTVDYRYQAGPVSVTLDGDRQVTVTENGVAGDMIKSIANFVGSSGADRITGDGAANRLDGSMGNDIIKGMGGNDKLISGIGQDTLYGGAGDDQFIYSSVSESSPQTLWLIDEIKDFAHGSDRLNFQSFDANFAKPEQQHFTLLESEGSGFTGISGQLRFDRRGGDTFVEGDTNGDKFADLIIMLDGNINLTKSDFML